METCPGVALVGYGYWGRNLARNLTSASSVRLAGIVDGDPAQRELASQNFPKAALWQSIDDALESAEVQAVVIATPAPTHGALALQTLEAGRHVLVEKPLALTLAEADAVVEMAERKQLVAMVGHTFLYSAAVHRLRDYVVQGELGEVQYLYSQRLSLGRIRRDCNALWNFAPHDVAIMLFLLSERPTQVSARGFAFVQAPVDDVCFATLAFDSGIGANLHVSWIDPRKVRLMTIVGDAKMAVYDDVSPDKKLALVDSGVARSANPSLGEYATLGEFQWRTRAGDIVMPHISMTEPLFEEVEDFGSCCRTGRRPLADAQHGRDVVRVLTAIDESVDRGGAPVDLRW